MVGGARKWSLLLWVTLCGFVIMGLSGFAIFFARGLFDYRAYSLDSVHLWGSLVASVVYLLYQWQHFTRVKRFTGSPLYRLGLATFWTMFGAIVTGGVLTMLRGTSVTLAHIFAGFAVLSLVSAHVLLAAWLYGPGSRR